jgi:hypothetical protein
MEMQQTGDLSRVGKSLEGYNKNLRVPTLEQRPPTTRMETLAKVFRVNLPGSAENEPFFVNDCSLSPDPDFSSLPNLDSQNEKYSADVT